MAFFRRKYILTLFMSWMFAFPAMSGIAVLDIAERNHENDESGDWSRGLYSATYMCDIAGYDYIVTKNLEEAMKQKVMLLSSCITTYTFDRDEWTAIDEWVRDGGVLVSAALRTVSSSSKDIIGDLFGVDVSQSIVKANDRKLINWNPEYFDDPELEYIDEENERATSIGEIKSFSLAAAGCDVLAHYDNGQPAVSRNFHGKGKTYIASITWRDVVQRNQLNKDQKSSREYNNGFEPSSDVWALFLRSIHASVSGVSAWKFTVPGGYTQLLVPTHDCDSRTAYDEMHYMADYEKSLGLKGHYFLTVHYFSDKINFGHSYLSDFYNSTTIPKAAELLADRHTIGSHSICHFPDFNKTRNTDVVTRDEYALRATCVDGVSTGASTWAEIVMSKQILEEDLGNNVRSFRSGHLCVNPDFHAMMKEADYSFQSCYTGGDILSEFPFFGRYDNQWEGALSDVLTMQLHISDVYNNKEGVIPLNDDTWNTHPAPDDWYDAMRKLRGNYASAVLLIHPNREWKMQLQKRLIDKLDHDEVALYNFEDYGDFWLSRLNADYSYDYNAATGVITIMADLQAVKNHLMTFAIEVYDYNLDKVVLTDFAETETLETELRQLAEHRYLVIPKNFGYAQGGAVAELPSDFVQADGIYDLGGRVIVSGSISENVIDSLPKGIYIIKEQNTTRKLKI